jgi:hypothetical protein
LFELVRCSRCLIPLQDHLPQFPGVNAPHLAIGVQPWFSGVMVADGFGCCNCLRK